MTPATPLRLIGITNDLGETVVNKQSIKLMVCTVLWTAVVVVGIGGSARMDFRMMFWSGITALVACCVSGHIIAECAAQKACRQERIHADRLVELTVDRLMERRGLELVGKD